MKINRILFGALAVGVMASCSNDGPDYVGGGDGMTTDGYMAVSVNLPTTPGTRAANDDFNDGLPEEYSVSNGALLLFSGDNEAGAVFHSAYTLELDRKVGDSDNDNITTSYLTAVQVKKVETGRLFGLVMLNYKGVGTVGADGSFTIAGEATPFTGNFAALNGKITDSNFIVTTGTEKGFFMTNAPLSTVAGGTVGTPALTNVITLVELTNILKPTREEAIASPAGSFFVERAVAKATLAIEADGVTLKDDAGNVVSTLKMVGNVEWALDNTEPTSYIVRNMGTNDFMGYANGSRGRRFAGTAVMGTTSIQPALNLYRTYWCVDPHYAPLGAGEANPFVTTTDAATLNFIAAGETPLYCHENTFNVEAQDHRHTTRAVVKVAFSVNNDGQAADFWTVNDVQTVIYKSAEEAESFTRAFILNDVSFQTAIKKALKPNTSVTIDDSNYKQYVDLKFVRDNDGYRRLKDVTFKTNDAFASAPVWDTKEAVIADANSYYAIAEYKGGVNYYDLRFKHFAGVDFNDINDLAPWNPADLTVANTTNTAEAYPGFDAAKWLRRYGMVRNNWYDVTVGAFNRLGKPEVPSADVSTPDDEKKTEQWISFKVNILAWAKRTQRHEF